MGIELWQWGLGALAAILVGLSKTGVPGLGIAVVPVMAAAFGGKPSVGFVLPMLIIADCFAVTYYRRHAQWDKLWGLFPWVGAGILLGAGALWAADHFQLAGGAGGKDLFKPFIGLIVLVMLLLHLIGKVMKDRLTPKAWWSLAWTGVAGGFSTTVANAAGPVMTLYLAGKGMKKHAFMGTNAWFFFLLNLTKVPVYVVLSLIHPDTPMFTRQSLLFDLCMVPVIVLGALLGRWLLHRIPQRVFDILVLCLAGIAAVKLLLP
ncbi:MAG: sulfite exporter TauE/SafE family protein [Verrucomicrobiota bacterium]|nr:sulfite exporter TauE/SafE family protein [Verrucomicrobiota bacterium]